VDETAGTYKEARTGGLLLLLVLHESRRPAHLAVIFQEEQRRSTLKPEVANVSVVRGGILASLPSFWAPNVSRRARPGRANALRVLVARDRRVYRVYNSM